MKIGCHVSIAGGIEKAPQRARELGAECFQIFSRSPQGGKTREITPLAVHDFLNECLKFDFASNHDYIIHSPYYINLASENNRIFYGSVSALKKELQTATQLKAPFVVTHLGSSKDLDEKDLQTKINEKVLKGLRKIHENYSGSAMLLLEIAAGSGKIIGDSFQEIGFFIKTLKKEHIQTGFCFDTCHAFAAGYDLRSATTVKRVFEQMDKEIGLENLKCIHFNDSQAELASRIDRHEHIGKGEIGQEGLKEVFRQAQKLDIHLFLETKHDSIEEDLKLVKSWRTAKSSTEL